MTFPHRAGYLGEQQRQQRKSAPDSNPAETAQTSVWSRKRPSQLVLRQHVDSGRLKQELRVMLTSLSPTNGPGRMLASTSLQMPDRDELKAQVERARQRLFEDSLFQQNAECRRLVTFSKSPILQTSSGGTDPFDAAIELLPRSKYPPDSDNGSQYAEEMARAVHEVVDDSTVRARYDLAARSLQEYEARRMNQQQRSSRGTGLMSPPSTFSFELLSPFALELATRNNTPRKRSSLSKTSKILMREWFEENLHHPYPTEEEKEWLASQGGITLEQVNNWFINTRGRKWKPMLNRLMAEKQAGDCKLYDKMIEKIEEPYHREL